MTGLMTSKQAADYLGYSEYHLRRSRTKDFDIGGAGTPKYIKLPSGAVRYKKEDLDDWIEKLQEV